MGDNTTTLITFGFLALMFVGFYFLIIRPQRKRQQQQQQLTAELKTGDRVITWSGIYGEIISLEAESFVLKVDSGATMRMARQAVAQKQYDPAK
ncbi:MAG: preprotein translocase subunit YajC [Dehalococcoidia bacterium]|nr:preprotein translocase subunit YajC [Dehalococcoidia bacterium]